MIDWQGNTVVYTSVITDFEHLGTNHFTDGVDYVFFTDGASRPVEDRWRVEIIPNMGHIHPRRVSKLPKHVPWYFASLCRYKYAVWIDGDMQIVRSDFVPEIMEYLSKGLVLSPHFDGRKDAYGEATIRPAKYAFEPLDEQVATYRQFGFPDEYGLYETGVLAWDLTNPQARILGYEWYLQNLLYSYQDQVSLPYVLWKTGFEPDVLPKSFRDLDWIHINAHKSEL